MNKGISFYINYHIKEEYVDTWKEAVNSLLEKVSKEESFISSHLNIDANDPTHFTLFERWDEASLELFIENQLKKKKYRIDYEKNLAKWSKCPCSFSNLQPVCEHYRVKEQKINK
jgi:quinol monooxygenase YgiN